MYKPDMQSEKRKKNGGEESAKKEMKPTKGILKKIRANTPAKGGDSNRRKNWGDVSAGKRRNNSLKTKIRAAYTTYPDRRSPGIECKILKSTGDDMVFECLADTGCTHTVVAEDVWREIGTEIEHRNKGGSISL